MESDRPGPPGGESAKESPFVRLLPSVMAIAATLLAPPAVKGAMRIFTARDGMHASDTAAPLETTDAHRDEPITPIPAPAGLDADMAALGKTLFHDPALSSSGDVSCASCHAIKTGGDDGQSVSEGVGGALGARNAPTVLNASLNFRQFWDGRATTLEDQVAGPIHNPDEMDSDWELVTAYLESVEGYRAWFARVFDDGVTGENVAHAIAEFERSLVTPDSSFDRWLQGDERALTESQARGYQLFKKSGCVSCHQGPNVGGSMFQPLGVMVEYFRAGEHEPDLGRETATGKRSDRHVFKVPGLRNVARTAPYFHDGSATTLEEAVHAMFEHQVGMPAEPESVRLICDFLESLSAEPLDD